MSEETTDKSQKTEQPTEHRLEKAREEGQIPLSREVTHLLVMVAVVFNFFVVVPSVFRRLVASMSLLLENASTTHLEGGGFMILSISLIREVGTYLAFFMLPIVFAVVVGGLLQTRFLISAGSMAPKVSKISFLKGLERMFGTKAIVEFLKSLLKIVVVGVIAFFILWPEVQKIDDLATMTISGVLSELHETLGRLIFAVAAVMLVLAGLDYAFQKFQFMKDMQMSRQEIKDEHKEVDGDPQIKQRLRQIRHDRARQRMIQEVPSATVIITNPTHFSIALKYDMQKMDAPLVIAKGVDFLALKIREVAKEHDVPIVENPPLARSLYDGVEVGDEIPLEYYEVVAKIIRRLLRLPASS